jgi:transcriptional regulator with PAS, ATPase and Fis domain
MHRVRQMPVHDPAPAGDIVGSSPLLLRSIQRARSAACTGADVLIEAESGTGKELLARFIHDSSDRCRKPFVAVNCAAVPEALLESELFGHGRGAFTGAIAAKPGKFELADGGTILLDEIGEMPFHLQPKLLRALQEREFERLGEGRSVQVDIRVIATTNVSLAAMVERGQFRGDLYYRLNVIPLSLPPLRDRREDIPILAQHFARKYAAQLQTKPPRLHPEFLDLLQLQSWPGNVRELANFMRRVLTLSGTSEIDAGCFEMEFQKASRPFAASQMPVAGAVAGTPIRQVERLHLENTLALTDGNRTHAAEMLGISLRTLRNKIREYGLPPRRYA